MDLDSLPHVAGMDTGLTSSGVATAGLVMRAHALGQKGVTLLPLAERTDAIIRLGAQVVDLALLRPDEGGLKPSRYPDLVVIEAPDVSRSYGGLVERVQLIHEIQRTLLELGIPWATVTSAALKGYATGNGGVDPKKKRVIAAVEQLWPEYGEVNDDKADGAVLAAMGLDWLTGVRRVPDEQAAKWLRHKSGQWPADVRWTA
jgi:hypothetical protein